MLSTRLVLVLLDVPQGVTCAALSRHLSLQHVCNRAFVHL